MTVGQERMTDRARRVMHLANKESQEWQHEYIGTEHIMLGLIKERSGVAGFVLADLGLIDSLEKTLRGSMHRGPEIVTCGKLPLTPKARQAIEKAHEWTSKLGHGYVGTEHLLLGLIDVQDSVVAAAIECQCVETEEITKRCLQFLGHEKFDIDKPANCGGPIPLTAIAPIMMEIMRGKWVRLVDRKLEVCDGNPLASKND